ncbi:TPA: hypothetical protein ACXGFL_000433 [Klebsiella pneumoniae]
MTFTIKIGSCRIFHHVIIGFWIIIQFHNLEISIQVIANDGVIISLANLPLRGEKKAAISDLFRFVFHAEKTPGSRRSCPGGREINSVYYFSDGEIRKKGARLTPIDGGRNPKRTALVPVFVWR